MINEESKFAKDYFENKIDKMENHFAQMQKEVAYDNIEMKKNIGLLKDYVNIDMPCIKNKIENETELRNKNVEEIISDIGVHYNKFNENVKFVLI